jgi:hypothetical protein
MLALAISFEQTSQGQVIETNDGAELIARDWPQDSETQLVVFAPDRNPGDVVQPSEVAEDIARLLALSKQYSLVSHKKPDWYERLERYALR